ncbi:MAG TPA: hypothetical protein VEW66_01980, partial [Thermomicrobiales bacterium]|nr:hypothetical protein [Thermomicrobiales bacterium]
MERWRSILPLLMVAIVLAGCSLAQLRPTPHSFANCLQSAPAPKDVTGVFVAPDDRLAPIIDEL